MNEIIQEMERYAEANNVPIIEKDSIAFVNKYIQMNNVKSILELGTAIGYSAILMATASEDVEITTITELSGVVRIYDGTEFKNYLIYIFNGTNWDQYIPYVFDGTKWCICS